MALKDWKKAKETKKEIEWVKKDKSDRLLFIKEDFQNYPYKYVVWNLKNTFNESFKTKPKALAYARSYMRKH